MSTRHRVLLAVLVASLLAACAPGTPNQSAPTAQAVVVDRASPSPSLPTTDLRTPDPVSVLPTEPPFNLPDPPATLTALMGVVAIDGSSTVFPITEAATTAFRDLAPGVTINLGVSGTGGGFRRFCAGETSISNASRPIKAEEAALCAANGISFVELPIAYDGLSLAVNQGNQWAQCLTTTELRQIWEPAAEGRFMRWSDIRPDWPDRPLNLYGAGGDSGTFDYFTVAVVGKEGQIRADYIASEDDYLIAQDLVDDLGGMGFFGYTYIVEYADELRAVAIDNGAGCVLPNDATITDGTYQPLSRPLFVYVRADHVDRPELATFLNFYLANAPTLVAKVRSIPLPPRAYELVRGRLAARTTGSVFDRDVPIGISITQLLELEGD
ncbi:MAG: PstS family phosphate ABC transporter substrate-binding protein [Oscillochloridaceae bacterium umkhey_bin13]